MSLELNLEQTFTLDTQYTVPKVFIVVGAGGTGGYFIPNLARQISIMNNLRKVEGLVEHKLLIIDEDTVSLSNLNRQNFIEKDLDKNKAEVLSTRYGIAFGLNIQYLDQYIINKEMLQDVIASACPDHCIPVLVDCVDNNKTRVFIHEAIEALRKKYQYGIFSLSSGNEFLNGQVVCGYKTRGIGPNEHSHYEENIFETPSVVEMFPEILEGGDKLPTELSCDEATVSHPQNIMTNITAANHLFNFANILLTAKLSNQEMPGLTYFAVTFDTQKGIYRTFLNKESVINQYIGK